MTGILFFDTETTGKLDFSIDLLDPQQPDLIQLGFILDNDDRKTVAEGNFLLSLEDEKEIEEGAMHIHGIKKDLLDSFGINPKIILALFNNLVNNAHLLVAHNIDFDLKIMKLAFNRQGKVLDPRIPTYCTMRTSTYHCKLPGTRFGYKWPKLTEAYKLLVNEAGFEGAHDALADVRACRDLYYTLKDI